MIGLECLLATVGILERSDVIRAFPKRFTSSCNFARSGKGLIGKRLLMVDGGITCHSKHSAHCFVLLYFFLPAFLEENYAKIFSNSGNIVAAKYVEGDETVMRLYFLSR